MLPKNANVMGSHVIYKQKYEDDKSLKLKSRIAPHGKELPNPYTKMSSEVTAQWAAWFE